MGVDDFVLVERDFDIIKIIYRFRFCLGRHIVNLANFSGSRACDRRLKLLVEAKYLERKKYLYGIPYLYTTAHKGRILIGVNKRAENIRIERIMHDITVLDCVCFFIEKYNISLTDITTEKELHVNDGFGRRRHQPDFMFIKNDQKYAVEIELAVKSEERIRNNMKDNFLMSDYQIWMINRQSNKINQLLNKIKNEYPNMTIVFLEDVLGNVRGISNRN